MLNTLQVHVHLETRLPGLIQNTPGTLAFNLNLGNLHLEAESLTCPFYNFWNFSSTFVSKNTFRNEKLSHNLNFTITIELLKYYSTNVHIDFDRTQLHVC